MSDQIVDIIDVAMPGATGDVTPEALQALDDARGEADRATDEADRSHVEANRAEVFAANTVELQDSAVSTLLADPMSASTAGVGNIVSDRIGVVFADDYITNDDVSTGISTALDIAAITGAKVAFSKPGTYFAKTSVYKADIPAHIDFNGVKVVRANTSSRDPVIRIEATVAGIQPATLDISAHPTYGLVGRVGVADSGQFAVGDYIVLTSDDRIKGALLSRDQRDGERVKVLDITAGYLWLASVPRANLVTNVHVGKMNPISVVIDNLTGTDEFWPAPATPSLEPFVQLINLVKPEVRNVKLDRLASEAVEYRGCIEHKTLTGSFNDLVTSSSGFTYGYGVVDRGGCDGFHTGLSGGNIRHVFTSGGLGSPAIGNTDPKLHGGTYGVRVTQGDSVGAEHHAFDFHEEAARSVIDSCRAIQNHTHPSASRFGFQLRGNANAVTDCYAGTSGGVDASFRDGGDDFLIKNFVHMPTVGGGSIYNTLRVRNHGEERANLVAEGITSIMERYVSSEIHLFSGNLDVVADDITVKAFYDGTGTLTVTRVHDGCVVRIGKMKLNVDWGPSAIGRIFHFGGEMIPSEVYVSELHVYSDRSYYLGDLANGESTLIIDRLYTNREPFGSGFNQANNATVSVNEVIVDGVRV